MSKRTLTLTLAALLTMAVQASTAQAAGATDGAVTIGVLTDMSSIFADIGGKGSVVAAQMAADDFGGKVLGVPIRVISADHQNKTDVAATIARDWFDNQHVDMVQDLLPSSVALAVSNVARAKHRIAIASGAGTTRLSNEDCSPYTVQYSYDTYSFTHSLVKSMVQAGDNSWYFLTVDYALGASLEKDATAALLSNNGKLVGKVKHPINSPDLSSFLLQAQASKAQVIGLADAGADTVNAIKTAREFGITGPGKQKLAALHMFISDVNSVGLPAAQGMLLTTPFYWDRDDASRAWSQRFFAKTGRMPTLIQAGVYSSTTHYLKAVQAAGTDEADPVMAKMKATPVNDFFAKNGTIREDGLMVHDMYVVEVKSPQQSKKPWDYYTVKQVIAGKDAFAPISASRCPAIAKK
ncbi:MULTISPECIES: ABC transporter substrate-binding protein [Paraburkholderia]|uniref:ABC transporter substrate-binding protein n=1 Tax=Paraburkholderia dipogonis TaxID=1211383 RepID=A0A4Y8MGY0_9BURK|nr:MULTISPECIES: ABC transporter substrate-binding protein [Paraburkholderia]RKR31323.1 amino acid/amide ABC transporter substrate-binding protein (HAAT family) [Paraburkholderia sp. BL17N1]TFE36707.1 ABC transporter substrate-binding protein [Paraburkholderia dipogonis]